MRASLLLTASFIILFANTSVGQQLTKMQQKIFKEKFFVAENLVLAENYTAALNILFELKGMESMNYNLRYKIGICFIHSGGKKIGSIPFLEAAAKNISPNYSYDDHTEREAPPQALRDLAHAYHLNYQLDTAIAVYKMFMNYLDEKQVDDSFSCLPVVDSGWHNLNCFG